MQNDNFFSKIVIKKKEKEKEKLNLYKVLKRKL